MAQTIKQWVEDEIQNMRDQIRPGQDPEEYVIIDAWIKYEKEIIKEITMEYNNSACWRNINYSDQCGIAYHLVNDILTEEADGQN